MPFWRQHVPATRAKDGETVERWKIARPEPAHLAQALCTMGKSSPFFPTHRSKASTSESSTSSIFSTSLAPCSFHCATRSGWADGLRCTTWNFATDAEAKCLALGESIVPIPPMAASLFGTNAVDETRPKENKESKTSIQSAPLRWNRFNCTSLIFKETQQRVWEDDARLKAFIQIDSWKCHCPTDRPGGV